jgi:hypothetical protein
MTRTNNYAGQLPVLFPGTAKRWLEWFQDILAEPTDYLTLRGSSLPRFLSDKEIKKYGLKDLDSVVGLLRPDTPYPGWSWSDAKSLRTQRPYSLEEAESILAHIYHMEPVEVLGTHQAKKYRVDAVKKVIIVKKDEVSKHSELGHLLESKEASGLRRYLSLVGDPSISDLLTTDDLSYYLWDAIIDQDERTEVAKEVQDEIEGLERKLAHYKALAVVIHNIKVCKDTDTLVEVLREQAPRILAVEKMDELFQHFHPTQRPLIRQAACLALGASIDEADED